MGGSQYFVMFVDEFSRYLWIYHLRNRSELPQVCYKFAAMVRTQFFSTIIDRIMHKNIRRGFLTFLAENGTLPQNHALASHNRMVVQRENITTFLKLFVLYLFLLIAHNLFGEKLPSPQYIPSIASHLLSLKINLLMSGYIELSQITVCFKFSGVLVL